MSLISSTASWREQERKEGAGRWPATEREPIQDILPLANLHAPFSGSLLSMMNDGKSGAPLFCSVWSMDDFSVEGPDARRNEEASDKFGQG